MYSSGVALTVSIEFFWSSKQNSGSRALLAYGLVLNLCLKCRALIRFHGAISALITYA